MRQGGGARPWPEACGPVALPLVKAIRTASLSMPFAPFSSIWRLWPASLSINTEPTSVRRVRSSSPTEVRVLENVLAWWTRQQGSGVVSQRRFRMTASEPVKAHEQLRRQREVLADFGLFAFRCDDMDGLLHRATELVSEALGVPLVKVLEHRPERGEMLVRSGVNWQEGVVGRETFGDHEKSPGGYALKADGPVVSPDLDLEDRFETPDVLRRHGVMSMVNVVIAGEDAAFGVLEVDARERRDFGDDEVAFLRTYANLLAAAIERLRTHDELRRSVREQGLLARELGHRVRNVLGLVRALASRTSAEGRTAEEFRAAFIERLHALSVAEGLVFASTDERVDPEVLAREVLAPYRQDGPARLVIDGVSVRLSARQARMFGLALHELATNAMKHGALGVPDGSVRLDWHIEDAEETQRRLSMTWQEANGPEITPPERKGFGTRLLEDVVAHELNGEAELDYARRGLTYRLRFQLEGDQS